MVNAINYSYQKGQLSNSQRQEVITLMDKAMTTSLGVHLSYDEEECDKEEVECMIKKRLNFENKIDKVSQIIQLWSPFLKGHK